MRSSLRLAVTLYVIDTGVEDPLVDFLDDNLTTRVRPVYFTHGDRRNKSWPRVDLGKALLVGRLYGAFSVGTHDDLVTALGLAVVAPREDAVESESLRNRRARSVARAAWSLSSFPRAS